MLPFDDVVRDRILDIHMLARSAGHGGHQGVPVVGRGNHDGINGWIVQETPKVLMSARGMW